MLHHVCKGGIDEQLSSSEGDKLQIERTGKRFLKNLILNE